MSLGIVRYNALKKGENRACGVSRCPLKWEAHNELIRGIEQSAAMAILKSIHHYSRDRKDA